ncbi:hypothetical protein APHNP_1292 [Anaplasma phagocytophilum str. ApNP]|uniref:Uncharacterized protein n=1 Tax=Anaplasma phagocytophilum str. ApNP TaxID=1359153 RepID=A0A0F3NHS0_ANAPH|nr:hypothetical protein APHNP_1292 [Anaplasma phagocytophilum str. ApNP]
MAWCLLMLCGVLTGKSRLGAVFLSVSIGLLSYEGRHYLFTLGCVLFIKLALCIG